MWTIRTFFVPKVMNVEKWKKNTLQNLVGQGIMIFITNNERYQWEVRAMGGKNSEAMKLENQICFPLYAASREIIKCYRPFLDELGLTYTQYIVMLVIWEMGTVSVRDLGRQLFLDSGTLTPVLKTLEKNGLITRCRSTLDERVLLVSATSAGSALKEKVTDVPQAIREASHLTDEEAAALIALANKLLASSGDD